MLYLNYFYKKSILLILLGFFSLSSVTLANVLDPTVSLASKKLLKIAVMVPLNGKDAAYGKILLAAVNAAKLQLDLNLPQGLTLEIIPFNDQADPELAKILAYKVLNDPKIKIVIGHIDPLINTITSKIYATKGILQLIPNPTLGNITEQNINTLFRITGSLEMQAHNISEFLSKKFTNIAILHAQTSNHKYLAMQVAENLANSNKNLAIYQSIDPEVFLDPKKLKKILKKLKKLNIEIVFFAGNYTESACLINNMDLNKLKIPFLTSDQLAIKDFIPRLTSPKLATGIMMSFPNMGFTKELTTDFLGQAIFWYAAMEIAWLTITNCDLQMITDPWLAGKTMANWLHNNTIPTILGSRSWDTNGNNLDPEFKIYIWDEYGNYWPLS